MARWDFFLAAREHDMPLVRERSAFSAAVATPLATAATPLLADHRILRAQTEMCSETGPPLADVTLIAVGLREPVGVQWR